MGVRNECPTLWTLGLLEYRRCVETHFFLYRRIPRRCPDLATTLHRTSAHFATVRIRRTTATLRRRHRIDQHARAQQHRYLIGRRTTGDRQIVHGERVRHQHLIELDKGANDVIPDGPKQYELGVTVAQVQLHRTLHTVQLGLDQASCLLANAADLLRRCPRLLP